MPESELKMLELIHIFVRVMILSNSTRLLTMNLEYPEIILEAIENYEDQEISVSHKDIQYT